jgi:hypothetical protein
VAFEPGRDAARDHGDGRANTVDVRFNRPAVPH